jgi:hypothetical protein
MKLKIYFDDIEIGLPIDTTTKKINENLEVLKETFTFMVENAEVLEKLKLNEYDGR